MHFVFAVFDVSNHALALGIREGALFQVRQGQGGAALLQGGMGGAHQPLVEDADAADTATVEVPPLVQQGLLIDLEGHMREQGQERISKARRSPSCSTWRPQGRLDRRNRSVLRRPQGRGGGGGLDGDGVRIHQMQKIRARDLHWQAPIWLEGGGRLAQVQEGPALPIPHERRIGRERDHATARHPLCQLDGCRGGTGTLERVGLGGGLVGVEVDMGLLREREWVVAGITCPASNGPTEGANTKLKLSKRVMYGRAGFPLLRQRVLHAL